MGRGIAATAVVALLAAGCGTSSRYSTAPGATSARSTTSPAPTTAADAQAWIDAATTGLTSDPDRPAGLTDARARCMAHALVDVVTVARLRGAGTTLIDLSDPARDLPVRVAAITPTTVKLQLGAAMQRCGVGELLGGATVRAIAHSIGGGYQADAASVRCAVAWMNAPARRELIADAVLHGSTSASSSTDEGQFAGLFLDCLDFAAVIGMSVHVTFDAGERACINGIARQDAELRSALAAAIEGHGKADDVFTGFGVRIVGCLTPAHLRQMTTQGTTPAV